MNRKTKNRIVAEAANKCVIGGTLITEQLQVNKKMRTPAEIAESRSQQAIFPEETKANAAFIVRACNNFEQLLAACKFVIANFDMEKQGFDKTELRSDSINALWDAIKRAEE